MKRLQEKDIEKFAKIAEIPLVDALKIHALGVLDEHAVFNCIIKHEFRRIKRIGQYTTKQIVLALANEYQVSRTRVTTAAYTKRKTVSVCKECGRVTGKAELKRNGGLCDECKAMRIQL